MVELIEHSHAFQFHRSLIQKHIKYLNVMGLKKQILNAATRNSERRNHTRSPWKITLHESKLESMANGPFNVSYNKIQRGFKI